MEFPHFSQRTVRGARAAFSLVEVALSLGVVGFVMAGLIGAIPLASNVGRQSIEQNRAASIAGTVFTTLRAGKFSGVSLQDDGTDTVVLNNATTSDPAKIYYAYFDEVTTSNTSDARRLHFVGTAPVGTLAYRIAMRFNNNPPGTLAPSANHAQANAVEISINSLARPKDVYRFSSVVANRSE